jgi:hypothetical protein
VNRFALFMVAAALLLTGCAQGVDATKDVPALDRAKIVDLLPTHSAINTALGKDLPYIQEPREIVLQQNSTQPSDGTSCELAEFSTGHPEASTAGQVVVGTGRDHATIEVFRFSEVGSATKFMKTVSTLQDECAVQKKAGITSWTTRESGFSVWRDTGQPHAAFQRGAVVGYVAASSEEYAAKITKLLSDTMADFK